VSLVDALSAGRPLLLDGGLGSAVIARGLPRGTPPEAWVLERPEEIQAVHRGYVEAGSDAVQTCTFGASPVRLAAFGLDHHCEELNRRAVDLARAAGPRFVVGDVGPTGEYLPPVGTGDEARWRETFARQTRALMAAGVDAFHVETMSDLREAKVALAAIHREAPGMPVMVSLTFDHKRRGYFTVMGDPLIPALRALAEAGAVAVGANCTLTSPQMAGLVEEALAGVEAPLVVQPNAGAPEALPDGSFTYAQTPEDFARDLAVFAAAGVALVGGCCGTDRRFIAALRRRLDEGTASP
jgi:5-methyltetrahydrofolate--homocysteine methyltransferase